MNPRLAFRSIPAVLTVLLVTIAMPSARSAEPPGDDDAAAAPAATARRSTSSGDHDPQAARRLFDGKSLKQWKVADEFEFEDHGAVRVEDGSIVLEAGMPATGVVLATKPPRTEYELTLEARRADGRDFFCGLTFPVNEQYCTLILGGWGGGVIGLSNVDRNSAVENATTTFRDFELKRWYAVRLRVTGKAITVWLDDKQIIYQEVPDHRFNVWWEMEPMRPLGIATWYTRGELRKIKLTHPLPADAQPKPAGQSAAAP